MDIILLFLDNPLDNRGTTLLGKSLVSDPSRYSGVPMGAFCFNVLLSVSVGLPLADFE